MRSACVSLVLCGDIPHGRRCQASCSLRLCWADEVMMAIGEEGTGKRGKGVTDGIRSACRAGVGLALAHEPSAHAT